MDPDPGGGSALSSSGAGSYIIMDLQDMAMSGNLANNVKLLGKRLAFLVRPLTARASRPPCPLARIDLGLPCRSV